MVDFDVFMKALKREYSKHKLEYIAVAEPQERGAWHMHLMLKSDQPVLYIPHETMDRLWKRGKDGKGSTNTVRLKSDDVGAYYTSYFKSLEAEGVEDPNAVYVTDEKTGKKYKKGARLHFYPKGMKFYRCSRGIARPEKENTVYRDVKKEYGKPVKTVTYGVTESAESEQELDEMINVIQHEQFKNLQEAMKRDNNPNVPK
jgi:hypothetical protein